MGNKLFTFKGNEMLFWRVGPMNSRKQKHWKQPGTHQPPVRRGMWAFPYGHNSYFFVHPSWERLLPKRFKGKEWENLIENGTDEEVALAHAEKELLKKDIIKRNRPSTFYYGGGLYSHISASGDVDYNEWFYWLDPKSWANEARKHIFTTYRMGDILYRDTYARDHLELFIPNY